MESASVKRPIASKKQPGFAITILTDADSWMRSYLPSLQESLEAVGHTVTLVGLPEEIPEGDFSVFLSSTRVVPQEVLARNRHNLVVHQSDLPKGRGWSPLSWQILEGKDTIPVCLFEASSEVDTGLIYLRSVIRLTGTELVAELREAQALSAFEMVIRFFREYPGILKGGRPQVGDTTYYARRRAIDNRLDPDKSIREQFNLLRIVDNDRYPAYFELGGQTYVLRIEKVGPTKDITEQIATSELVSTPMDSINIGPSRGRSAPVDLSASSDERSPR
jgi:methionyl-tRNA formyltransferase